jgi:hypothetical protein
LIRILTILAVLAATLASGVPAAGEGPPISAAQAILGARKLYDAGEDRLAAQLLSAAHRLQSSGAKPPTPGLQEQVDFAFTVGWMGHEALGSGLPQAQRRLVAAIGRLHQGLASATRALDLPDDLGASETNALCDALAAAAHFRRKPFGEVLGQSAESLASSAQKSEGLRRCLFNEVMPGADGSEPIAQIFARIASENLHEVAAPLAIRYSLEGRYGDGVAVASAAGQGSESSQLTKTAVAIRQVKALSLSDETLSQALLANWQSQPGLAGLAFGWTYLSAGSPARLDRDKPTIMAILRQDEPPGLRRRAALALLEGGLLESAADLMRTRDPASLSRILVAAAFLKSGSAVAAEMRRAVDSRMLGQEPRGNLGLALIHRLNADGDSASARRALLAELDRIIADPNGPTPTAYLRAIAASKILEKR